jgi:AraC-like DNA-binding protein
MRNLTGVRSSARKTVAGAERRPAGTAGNPAATRPPNMAGATDFPTLRLSTDDLPEKDRVTMWREYYAHAVIRADIEPAEDTLFRATMTSRRLPGLQLLWANFSAHRLARTREFVADGEDDLALLVNCTGALAVAAAGREVVLRERDAVLVRSGDVGKSVRFVSGGSFSLRIPRSLLSALVADIDAAVMRHITKRNEALRLLTGYAGALPDGNGLAAPGLAPLVVNHVHDLVALTLGATRDAADAARVGGVRAARLSAAKTYIMQNSARRDLSVSTVAAHLGVSPRALQMMFEVDGTTFSAFLLTQRLTRAHRLLCAPQSSRHAVSTIAYDVGFGDLSYFNRCFRRFYGLAPRDLREAAVQEPR